MLLVSESNTVGQEEETHSSLDRDLKVYAVGTKFTIELNTNFNILSWLGDNKYQTGSLIRYFSQYKLHAVFKHYRKLKLCVRDCHQYSKSWDPLVSLSNLPLINQHNQIVTTTNIIRFSSNFDDLNITSRTRWIILSVSTIWNIWQMCWWWSFLRARISR